MTAARCAVVVVALHGGRSLEECLSALQSQGAPCTVMLGAGMGDASAWCARFPRVRFIDAATLPVPRKRAAGLAAADAEFVALLEDSCVPHAGWFEAVQALAAVPQVGAAGGPVTLADDLSAAQKALGCCEYGRFHPACMPAGSASAADALAGGTRSDRLPGNNLAYRRDALAAAADVADGLVETSVHAQLLAAGRALVMHPRMRVEYRPRDARGTRAIDRFRHGRLYGATHTAGRSAAFRAWCLLKAFALPAVLSWRSLRWMTRAVRRSAWLAVAPWVLGMETAWAAGEAVGCIAGPGESLERWH